MKLPRELEALIRDQAKHEDSDGYFGFITGAEWLFEHLSQELEFDKGAYVAMLERHRARTKDGSKPKPIDVARWMFDFTKARVALMQARLDECEGALKKAVRLIHYWDEFGDTSKWTEDIPAIRGALK